jgi:hypothetical protein
MWHKPLRIVFIFSLTSVICLQVNGQVKGRRQPAKASINFEEQAKEISAELPQLSLPAARLMVRYMYDLYKKGIQYAEARRIGMETMARGKALLPEEEQREMEDINDQILDSYSQEERRRLEKLRIVISKGGPMTTDDKAFLMMLYKSGFKSLPLESQSRLRELNEKAIRAYLNQLGFHDKP